MMEMIKEDMMMPAGHLFKPHGYKGEIKCDMPLPPELFKSADIPVFLKMDGIPVPFFIESARGKEDYTTIVKFRDIDSDIDAAELANKEVLMMKSLLAEITGVTEEELELTANGYLGYEVVKADSGETIGTVEDIEDGVEYDYLVVRKQEDNEEINIPFIDEFVTLIKEGPENGKGKIAVSLPEGFLDI